jgi:hypothetical protein
MMARKKEPARKGRPPVVIDLSVFETFAELQATYKQMAAAFRCSERTILERMKEPEFQEIYERGKERGKLNLKQLQWRHAQGLDPNGNYIQGSQSAAVNMTKHLSQHWLGETDHPPATTMIQNNNTLALTHASESDLRALESILARIADASASEGRVIEAGGDQTTPAG